MRLGKPSKIIIGVALIASFFILSIHYWGVYHTSKYDYLLHNQYLMRCSAHERNLPFVDCYCTCYETGKFSNPDFQNCVDRERCDFIN